MLSSRKVCSNRKYAHHSHIPHCHWLLTQRQGESDPRISKNPEMELRSGERSTRPCGFSASIYTARVLFKCAGERQSSGFQFPRREERFQKKKKKDCILATCTLYLLLCISMLRLTIPHCWMVLLDDRKPFKCRKLMYGIQMTQL